MNSYNSLMSVEESKQKLDSHTGFDQFLSVFARTALTHGMQDLLGACMLHRHFTLVENQVIREEPYRWGNQRALVSIPSGSAVGNAAPSTWRFDPCGNLEPLEYSEDSAVTAAASAINSSFLVDYCALLREMKLEHLVGLTVLPRAHLPVTKGQQYLEETQDGRSIVTVVRSLDNQSQAITTVWAAGQFMGCSVYNTCHQRNSCHYANEEHRHILGHTTERTHHRS